MPPHRRLHGDGILRSRARVSRAIPPLPFVRRRDHVQRLDPAAKFRLIGRRHGGSDTHAPHARVSTMANGGRPSHAARHAQNWRCARPRVLPRQRRACSPFQFRNARGESLKVLSQGFDLAHVCCTNSFGLAPTAKNDFGSSTARTRPRTSARLYQPSKSPGLQNSRSSLQNFRKNRCKISYFGGEWCNGSTTDSDSVCLGSNPSSPAKLDARTEFGFFRPIPVSFPQSLAQ
jgi:hypothetical protein